MLTSAFQTILRMCSASCRQKRNDQIQRERERERKKCREVLTSRQSLSLDFFNQEMVQQTVNEQKIFSNGLRDRERERETSIVKERERERADKQKSASSKLDQVC